MGSIININQPNIRYLKPPKIIIDTNILIDVFYSNPLKNPTYRERQYQNYVSYCAQKKIPLYTTGINIYETFHVIDNMNKDMYNSRNGTGYNLKEYHKIYNEVEKVHTECQMVYKSIISVVQVINHMTSEDYIEDYIHKTNTSLDLYDVILLKIANDEKIQYILTHDADFNSNSEYIEGINILTQNSAMINAD